MFADNKPISFLMAATVGSTRYVLANNNDNDAWSDFGVCSQLCDLMFAEGRSRGVNRYDFGTGEQVHIPQSGVATTDRVETFTVAINHMVSGFWNAGVKLKTLFDGGLWGRPALHEQLASGEPLPRIAKSHESELVATS